MMHQFQSSQPIILEHGSIYLQAHFSLDGKMLAVANSGDSHSGNALGIVWNTQDWTERSRFQDQYLGELSFHPKGYVIASGNKLWEADTGRIIRQIEDVSRLTFSPDGKLLAGITAEPVSDGDEEYLYPEVNWGVLVLNGETGELIHRVTIDEDEKEEDDCALLQVRFTRDGQRIFAHNYAYDYSDRVYFWDAVSGTKLPTFDRVNEMGDFDVWLDASTSGRYVMTIKGEMQLWERENTPHSSWQHRYTCKGHTHGVWAAQFSPDEHTIATMGPESLPDKGDETVAFSVRLWEVVSGQEQAFCALAGKYFCFGISQDSSLLATMSAEVADAYRDEADSYILTLWDVPSGRIRAQQRTHSKRTNRLYRYPEGLRFSPDGRWLAVNHLRHVEVWDVERILNN